MANILKTFTGRSRQKKGWFGNYTEVEFTLTHTETGSVTYDCWEKVNRWNFGHWQLATFKRKKKESMMDTYTPRRDPNDPRPGPTDPTADDRCPNNVFAPRIPGCTAEPHTCPVHSPQAKQLRRELATVTARCAELERRLEVPAPSDAATYPMPEHGWTCFHCGETFKTPGGARLHFGSTPDAKPGCYLKVELGNERMWLARIRELEEANNKG